MMSGFITIAKLTFASVSVGFSVFFGDRLLYDNAIWRILPILRYNKMELRNFKKNF